MLARKERIREVDSLDRRREERRKELIEKRKKNRKRFKIISLGVGAFVMAVSVLYGYATITKMKMDISSLESERVALETEKEYMLANLEEIKSTSKIEDKAIIKLGMDYPKDDQIVYIDVNKEGIEEVENKSGLVKTIVNSVLGLF